MTDDIIEKLNAFVEDSDLDLMSRPCPARLVNPNGPEAAEEIERLRKENAELLATCQGWANTVSDFTRRRDAALERADTAIETLRMALKAIDALLNNPFREETSSSEDIKIESRAVRSVIEAWLKRGERV